MKCFRPVYVIALSHTSNGPTSRSPDLFSSIKHASYRRVIVEQQTTRPLPRDTPNHHSIPINFKWYFILSSPKKNIPQHQKARTLLCLMNYPFNLYKTINATRCKIDPVPSDFFEHSVFLGTRSSGSDSRYMSHSINNDSMKDERSRREMNNAKRSRLPGMRVPRRLRRIARLAPSLKSNDLAHFTDFYPRRAFATSVRRTAWTHLYRCRVGVADDGDEYDDEPFYRIRRRGLFGWGFSTGISRRVNRLVVKASSVRCKEG